MKKVVQPLVSVLVPTYNRAELLPECIESVLMQSEPNLELIVVDDGSTDSTIELMRYYTKRDQRVKYFRQENGGIAKARNTAFNVSSGKYIAVMDSDDVCNPERLKMSVEALKKYNADVVYSQYMRADEHMTVIDGTIPPQEVTLELVKENALPPHVTVLAKRKCFEENPYRDTFKSNDDFALLWDWFKAGYKFHYIDEPLVMVRFHAASTSATRDAEIRKFHEKILHEIKIWEEKNSR